MFRRSAQECRRRGVVAPLVAVLLVVIVGFTALAVDIGAMYNARADLQMIADAGAMAAAQVLSTHDGGFDGARAAAEQVAAENPVFGMNGTAFVLETADVEFGRKTSTTPFAPGATPVNAVRVTARLADTHTNGSLSLYFARVFGENRKDLQASATAALGPRDIAIVADLSASHNDDSELGKYRELAINLKDVWDAMPIPKGNNGVGNGIDPPPPGNPNSPNDPPGTGPGHPGNQGGNPDPGADPQGGQLGPTWGWMYYWGNELDSEYDPVADPGLMYFPRYVNWTNDDLVTWYENVGYSGEEIAALMGNAHDGDLDSMGEYAWTNRVAVALGLARWDSGLEGGLWEAVPPGKRNSGDGNDWVGGTELTWLVDYPFDSGSWSHYVYSYVRSTSTKMYRANSNFRYRFGLKTFINYLLEKKPGYDQTPELAGTPHQPMEAVQNAVEHMMNTIKALDSEDQVSLEVYGYTVKHEVGLGSSHASADPGATGVETHNYPTNHDAVAGRLKELQAGHYDNYTNMGGGIARAIETLTGANARPEARKVMIVLTDGDANVDESGNITSSGGRNYARAQAGAAAAAKIKIYTVSVSSSAATEFMQELADIGNVDGSEAENAFFAGTNVEEYGAELAGIFQLLGARRGVELVE